MGTTSITITEEAYNYLKAIKGKRSFSEVILSMPRSEKDIMAFAGILRDADLKSVEEAREHGRKEWKYRS